MEQASELNIGDLSDAVSGVIGLLPIDTAAAAAGRLSSSLAILSEEALKYQALQGIHDTAALAADRLNMAADHLSSAAGGMTAYIAAVRGGEAAAEETGDFDAVPGNERHSGLSPAQRLNLARLSAFTSTLNIYAEGDKVCPGMYIGERTAAGIVLDDSQMQARYDNWLLAHSNDPEVTERERLFEAFDEFAGIAQQLREFMSSGTLSADLRGNIKVLGNGQLATAFLYTHSDGTRHVIRLLHGENSLLGRPLQVQTYIDGLAGIDHPRLEKLHAVTYEYGGATRSRYHPGRPVVSRTINELQHVTTQQVDDLADALRYAHSQRVSLDLEGEEAENLLYDPAEGFSIIDFNRFHPDFYRQPGLAKEMSRVCARILGVRLSNPDPFPGMEPAELRSRLGIVNHILETADYDLYWDMRQCLTGFNRSWDKHLIRRRPD